MTLRPGRRSPSPPAPTRAISSPRWPSVLTEPSPRHGSDWAAATSRRTSTRRSSGSLRRGRRLVRRWGRFPLPRVVGQEARQENRAEEDSGDAEGSSGDHGGLDAEGGGDQAGFDVSEEGAAHVAHHFDAGEAAAEVVGDRLVPEGHAEHAARAVGGPGAGEEEERGE